jgi:hydrogenase expression/formation protein HypC
MCLMAPARVVSVDGSICQVELGGRIDPVSMILEPDLQVGDWVLVNSGTVVRRLEPDQAEEMTQALATMFEMADEAEAQALAEAQAQAEAQALAEAQAQAEAQATAASGAAGSPAGAIP